MKQIILAKPRGFCAGVERAIAVVEMALRKYGPPIYVRHEIVHNKHVVARLRERGAVFVDELDEIPKDSIVIFSAHGVSSGVEFEAKSNDLKIIDATCPLVKKVHHQVQKYEQSRRTIVLIGHNGHPEIEGTKGRVNAPVYVVENMADVESLALLPDTLISYATQTTLSIDDTTAMINALYGKFKEIQGPELNDICYATQNRQRAVKALAEKCDTIMVVGSKNSSNSNRLRDIGEGCGVASYLINDESDIELTSLGERVGVTAGASAPEKIVEDVVAFLLKAHPGAEIVEMTGIEENVKFRLPHGLE